MVGAPGPLHGPGCWVRPSFVAAHSSKRFPLCRVGPFPTALRFPPAPGMTGLFALKLPSPNTGLAGPDSSQARRGPGGPREAATGRRPDRTPARLTCPWAPTCRPPAQTSAASFFFFFRVLQSQVSFGLRPGTGSSCDRIPPAHAPRSCAHRPTARARDPPRSPPPPLAVLRLTLP